MMSSPYPVRSWPRTETLCLRDYVPPAPTPSHTFTHIHTFPSQISVRSWARTETLCLRDYVPPAPSLGALDKAVLAAEEAGDSVWLWVPPFKEMARLKAYIAVLLRSVQYHAQVSNGL